ncbi:MAG: S8 family serine peptidase [Gloeobacteraceae cyanobacterium ES-bin-144]|nr:S8 family serine peptidase [Verrucomicrobiales bacterium]
MMIRTALCAVAALILATCPDLLGQNLPNNNFVARARISGKAPLLLADRPANNTDRPPIPHGMKRYIVTLADATNQDACAASHRINRERSFKHALNGFVACLNNSTVERLRDRLDVLAIEEDRIVAQTQTQTVPTGVKRMAAEQFPTSMINGVDERINVDVAVLDSGVQANHPDLNVVQSNNIAGNGTNYHGTAVAGIIGALDNNIGVVGVAPGARIWSVRMGDSPFNLIDIIAAFDYVAANANQIAVANCSFGSYYANTNTRSTWETAIMGCINKGVVVVAAAGNDGSDLAGPNGNLNDGSTTDNTLPAGLPSVMAVSAMEALLDRFASYSNFSASNHTGRVVFSPGAGIDVAAPTNVLTTTLNNGYVSGFNGTSAASPHVAGLVALYIATHGRATDAAGVYRIRQAIVDDAQPQSEWGTYDTLDKDSNKEGLALAKIGWVGDTPGVLNFTKTPQGASIQFTTNSGYTHDLQYSNSLGMSDPWTPIFSIDGTGATSLFNHTNADPRGFYRVATKPIAWPFPSLRTIAINSGSLGAAGNGIHQFTIREAPGAITGTPSNRGARMSNEYIQSRVEIPYRSDFNPSGPFSFEFWVKPTLAYPTPCLASSFYNDSSSSVLKRAGWIFYQGSPDLTSNNGFYFRCYYNGGDNTFTIASASVAVNTNAWYHIVGVFDGANVILYVNGVNSASDSFPPGQTMKPNTSAPLTIGIRSDELWWGNESLDEPAFYPFALSAAQVLAHYQAGTNPSPPTPYHQVILNHNPTGYWRFNEP